MFNLFKKKEKKISNYSASQVFSMIGSDTLNQLWRNMVKGQNEAVYLFDGYKKFKEQIEKDYRVDEKKEHLYAITTEDGNISLSHEECMFIYLMNLTDDAYITDRTHITLLSKQIRETMISSLSYQETTYCDKLLGYLNQNIFPVMNKVDYIKYDTITRKRVIPLYTQKLKDYHVYMKNEQYFDVTNRRQRWNCIGNAPIWANKCKEEDPLWVANLDKVEELILDSICYATMDLPTEDIIKVIGSKNVEEAICDVHGENMLTYLYNAIFDMNGLMFRKSVRNGLLVK